MMFTKKEMIFNYVGICVMLALVFAISAMVVFVASGIIAGTIAIMIFSFILGLLVREFIHNIHEL